MRQFLLSAGFAVLAGAAHPQTTFEVSVWGFGSSTITNARIDQILSDATRLFQDADGPGDVQCALTFQRSGTYDRFPDTWGKVLTKSLSEYVPNDRTISIFDQITHCGNTTIPAGFTILGCARPSGPVTVTRHSKEVVIWAHEMGHGQGLSHHTDTNNLMFKEAALHRRFVTQVQCNAFLSGQDFPIVEASDTAPQDQPSVGAGDAAVLERPVAEMLDEVWVEGPPFARILEAPEELATLSREAIDAKRFDQWANAITILGLRGGPDDFRYFEAVLNEPVEVEPDVPSPIVEAKVAAPLALGYWSARIGDPRAIETLNQLAANEPAARITGLSNVERGADSVTPVMTNALIGLAIASAKSDVANEALIEARSRAGRGEIDIQTEAEPFFAGLDDLRAAIAERGLEAYLIEAAPE